MDLIKRDGLMNTFDEIPTIDGLGLETVIAVKDVKMIIGLQQRVEAVPLDPLCEWLAGCVAPPKFVQDPDATELKARWMSAIREVMDHGLLDP